MGAAASTMSANQIRADIVLVLTWTDRSKGLPASRKRVSYALPAESMVERFNGPQLVMRDFSDRIEAEVNTSRFSVIALIIEAHLVNIRLKIVDLKCGR